MPRTRRLKCNVPFHGPSRTQCIVPFHGQNQFTTIESAQVTPQESASGLHATSDFMNEESSPEHGASASQSWLETTCIMLIITEAMM